MYKVSQYNYLTPFMTTILLRHTFVYYTYIMFICVYKCKRQKIPAIFKKCFLFSVHLFQQHYYVLIVFINFICAGFSQTQHKEFIEILLASQAYKVINDMLIIKQYTSFLCNCTTEHFVIIHRKLKLMINGRCWFVKAMT